MYLKTVKKKNSISRGFTLVEIMIVVLILGILTLLAVPNVLRARLTAREAVAISNIKKISEAAQMYYSQQSEFPASLVDLSEAVPSYIDSSLASGNKDGYNFIYTLAAEGFTLQANVASGGVGRYFYTDESIIIREHANAPAGAGDAIVN